MSRLVDIEREEFRDVLFDEACVEGNQAKRIESELSIIAVDEKEIRAKVIDEVFDFLKIQRDKKSMKVNFDDLEIRKYKEQLKGGAS